MHPVIRITSFLILAIALSVGGGWTHVGVAAVMVVGGYGVAHRRGLPHLAIMIRRLRWLWLSLCVVYFWFTPGSPVWPALGAWSPSGAGVQEGLLRASVLLLIASGANLLLQTTARDQLLAAIGWIAAPVRFVGGAPDRLALRLTLVLETVPRIRAMGGQAATVDPDAGFRSRVGGIAKRVAARFRAVLDEAAAMPAREIAVPDTGAPVWREWLVPLAMLILFWLAGR